MNTVTVRYIVDDVEAAIDFYTDLLDFEVQMHPAPGFAGLARDSLLLAVNEPGAGGAGQAMPDGTLPEPGGWNRVQIEVEDISATVERLSERGANFRNEIVAGKGGKQILLEDPAGNAVELFEHPDVSEKSRVITSPGFQMSLLATSKDTDGTWSLIENEADPGQGPAPHWHKEMIEGIYTLEGEVDFEIDGEGRRSGPGEFVLVPPRSVHSFTVASNEPARFLIMVSPGGFEEYFEELQELRAEEDEWPPADMAPVIEVMERHDTYRPPVE